MERAKPSDYRDLVLWNRALDLTQRVYHDTRSFPSDELYGLRAQIRRAAVSIPSNIAEGAARRTTREFISFLHIARGSLAELQTQMLLTQRLGITGRVDWQPELDEIGRLLNALIRSLRRRLHSS